jgi:hypothetical protein
MLSEVCGIARQREHGDEEAHMRLSVRLAFCAADMYPECMSHCCNLRQSKHSLPPGFVNAKFKLDLDSAKLARRLSLSLPRGSAGNR